tara:strand:- start:1077 stop:2318 length:1242 start_codon:yes stop_codon:yes gene_type:complete
MDGQNANYVWCVAGPGGFGDSDWIGLQFRDVDTIRLLTWYGGTDIRTNRVFRDPSSWYHIVVRIDTTQSTAADRIRIYVNGTQETSFSTAAYPSQNHDYHCLGDSGAKHFVGCAVGTNISSPSPYDYMNGYITDFVQTSGYSYGPTSFGETDSTTGEWKPKVDLSVSYGDNGFRLKFENAAALGTDTSGQGHNLTVNNAGTNAKTVDTASNNFCTFNPLDKANNVTLSKGNLIAAIAGAGQTRSVASTMAMSKGKWYWEVYYTADLVSGFVGLVSADIGWNVNSTNYPSSGVNDNVGYNDGGTKYINGSGSSYGASWASGDTISVAVDLDNNTTIFYKNGASQGSISKTFTGSYYPVVQHQSSNGTSNFHLNTGNPAYTISSGNADANGHGNFEYAVPSGYYALCTKNINSYG